MTPMCASFSKVVRNQCCLSQKVKSVCVLSLQQTRANNLRPTNQPTVAALPLLSSHTPVITHQLAITTLCAVKLTPFLLSPCSHRRLSFCLLMKFYPLQSILGGCVCALPYVFFSSPSPSYNSNQTAQTLSPSQKGKAQSCWSSPSLHDLICQFLIYLSKISQHPDSN